MRKAGIHRQQVEATLHFLWEDLIDETFNHQNRLPKVYKTTVHRVEIKPLIILCFNMDAACEP